jgi:CBS domain-containing protein
MSADSRPAPAPDPDANSGPGPATNAAGILSGKAARILTARMDETVMDAARLMRRENVGVLVVTDHVGTEGLTVVGIFSERDVMRAVVDLGAAALTRPVASLMSREVVHCGPDAPVRQILDLMHKHRVRHLPVIDNHQLVGVISIRDLIGLHIAELDRRA